MKILQKILSSPTAVAVMTIHWIIVIFEFAFEGGPNGFHFHLDPVLYTILLVLNAPAIALTQFIFGFFVSAIEPDSAMSYASFTVLILFITIQWLMIGKMLEIIIREIKIVWQKQIQIFPK